MFEKNIYNEFEVSERIESITRFEIERLFKITLDRYDANSTGNFTVYIDRKQGNLYAFSYGTFIAMLDGFTRGNPIFTSYAVGYSNTTSKHTYKFIYEFANYNLSNKYCAKWLYELIEKNKDKKINMYDIKNIEQFYILRKG